MNTKAKPRETTVGESGRGVASITGAGLFFSLNTPLARVAYNAGSNPGSVVFLRAVVAVIGIGLLMISGREISDFITGRELEILR